jgi:hypothetical protein
VRVAERRIRPIMADGFHGYGVMDEMLKEKDETKLARVTEAFLKMKKFDIAKLKEAYEQSRSAA